MSKTEIERKKKKMRKVFDGFALSIASYNYKVITWKLQIYLSSILSYRTKCSSHLDNIFKQLPLSIKKQELFRKLFKTLSLNIKPYMQQQYIL